MSVIDTLGPRDTSPPTAVEGRIANDAADAADDLYVILPAYSIHQRWGPCYFMPKAGQLPARGDACLVVFDEDREPWVVSWWNGDPSTGGGGGASYPSGGDPGEVLTFQGPDADDVAWTAGTPGPQGPQGPAGSKGDKGDTGAQGTQGVKGDTGATGATGTQGPKGDTGAQGPQGVKGDTGAQGVKGDTGAMGPVGTVYDTDQIGTIKTFAGKVIPTNWMLADGRNLSRLGYPELFTAIGTTYGADDGSTFKLPDLRSRMIYGAAAADLSDVAASGGAATVALTEAQMPVHAHTLNGYDTRAGMPAGGGTTYIAPGGAANWALTPNHQGGVQNAGSGTAHENMPPFIRVAQIVKVTGAQVDAGGALVGPQGPAGVNATPALVSALPSPATDGQEVYYQNAAMAAMGVAWRLRYRTAAPGAYKWEYVGGPPLIDQSSVLQVVTTTAYTDGTDLLAVTLPLAGDYDLAHGYIFNDFSGTATYIYFAMIIAGVEVMSMRLQVWPVTGTVFPGSAEGRITGVAAGAVAKNSMSVSSGSGRWNGRWMRATPVRVG